MKLVSVDTRSSQIHVETSNLEICQILKSLDSVRMETMPGSVHLLYAVLRTALMKLSIGDGTYVGDRLGISENCD